MWYVHLENTSNFTWELQGNFTCHWELNDYQGY